MMTGLNRIGLACVFGLIVLSSSCTTTTPLDAGYRAVTGAAPQPKRNQRPVLVDVSPQDYERKLKECMDQGAWLVGCSEVRSTLAPSHDQIRIFAITRRADLVIVSTQPAGTSTIFQPIPIKAEKIETAGTGGRAATTRTSLAYREHQAGVLLSRVTLLRCAPLQPSSGNKQATVQKQIIPPQKATSNTPPTSAVNPPSRNQSKPQVQPKNPESTVYDTTKTIETIEDLKPTVSGD
jgi:hypothetical protein